MTFLNVQQSAEIIKIHPEYLRKKIREGKVKAHKNSFGYYFLSAKEVLRLRDERQTLRDANGKKVKMEDGHG